MRYMEESKIDKLLKNCKEPQEKEYHKLTKEHYDLIPVFIKDMLAKKDKLGLSDRVVNNLKNKLDEISGGQQ